MDFQVLFAARDWQIGYALVVDFKDLTNGGNDVPACLKIAVCHTQTDADRIFAKLKEVKDATVTVVGKRTANNLVAIKANDPTLAALLLAYSPPVATSEGQSQPHVVRVQTDDARAEENSTATLLLSSVRLKALRTGFCELCVVL